MPKAELTFATRKTIDDLDDPQREAVYAALTSFLQIARTYEAEGEYKGGDLLKLKNQLYAVRTAGVDAYVWEDALAENMGGEAEPHHRNLLTSHDLFMREWKADAAEVTNTTEATQGRSVEEVCGKRKMPHDKALVLRTAAASVAAQQTTDLLVRRARVTFAACYVAARTIQAAFRGHKVRDPWKDDEDDEDDKDDGSLKSLVERVHEMTRNDLLQVLHLDPLDDLWAEGSGQILVLNDSEDVLDFGRMVDQVKEVWGLNHSLRIYDPEWTQSRVVDQVLRIDLKWTRSEVVAMMALMLFTNAKTVVYTDYEELIDWIVATDQEDVAEFVLNDVLRKFTFENSAEVEKFNFIIGQTMAWARNTVDILARRADRLVARGGGEQQAVDKIRPTTSDVFLKYTPTPSTTAFKYNSEEDVWKYDRRFEAGVFTEAATWFIDGRLERNPRGAHIKSLKDWPTRFPFIHTSYPSAYTALLDPESLAVEHSMEDQVLLMELGGASCWLQHQFHPLADWDSYVALMMSASWIDEDPHHRMTRVNKEHLSALQCCLTAVENNQPLTFQATIDVFCERTFREEAEVTRWKYDHGGYLSAALEKLLLEASGNAFWGTGWQRTSWYSAVTLETVSLYTGLYDWVTIINTLVAKMDIVAVLVADALCWGLVRVIGKSAVRLLFDDNDPGCPRGIQGLPYTDSTASLFMSRYWKSHPAGSGITNLQASVRKSCFGRPLARLANTRFSEAIVRTTKMYATWGNLRNIDPRSPVTQGLPWVKDRELRAVLKSSINHCHAKTWTCKDLLWAACALIRHAEQCRGMYELKRSACSENELAERTNFLLSHSVGKNLDYHRHGDLNFEAQINLEQAEMLLGAAIENIHTSSLSLSGRTPVCNQNRTQARRFIALIKNTRSEWKKCDKKIERQIQVAKKEEVKKRERELRAIELAEAKVVEAQQKLVRKVAMGAIGNVLQAARDRDARAKRQRAKEELEMAARAAKEERRKEEERKASLARTIMINKAAVCLREETLAKRAVENRKAAQREAEKRERNARAQRKKPQESLGKPVAKATSSKAEEPVKKPQGSLGKPQGSLMAWSDLKTRTEAFNFVRAAFDKQLEASISTNTHPNKGIVGDAKARSAFNALLSPAEQRTFFRQIISDQRYWPRIRSLIGIPPFSFLLPEDEDLLRAAGIVVSATKPQESLGGSAPVAKATSSKAEVSSSKVEVTSAVSAVSSAVPPVSTPAERAREAAARARAAAATARAAAASTETAEPSPVSVPVLASESPPASSVVSQIANYVRWDKVARLSYAYRGWKETVVRCKAERLAVSRRATREHCNIIMQHHHKERQDRLAFCSTPKPQESLGKPQGSLGKPQGSLGTPQVSLGGSIPVPTHVPVVSATKPQGSLGGPSPVAKATSSSSAVSAEPAVSAVPAPKCMWQKDYQQELARMQLDSKQQWNLGTGWAIGRALWPSYGGEEYVRMRVRDRQQYEMQAATFHANSIYTARVREAQYNELRTHQHRLMTSANQAHNETLEKIKAEQVAASDAESLTYQCEMKKLEEQRSAMLKVVDNQNRMIDAFEVGTKALVEQRSKRALHRLRSRARDANASTSKAAPKHECVICFDAGCTHIATACGHVIGCGACCNPLDKCPICCAPTGFVEMRFPH